MNPAVPKSLYALGLCLGVMSISNSLDAATSSGLRVGAAAISLEADDSMVIAGGIHPGKASGQEGQLRATAVVLDYGSTVQVALVACDILMITRAFLDLAAAEIESATGIPASHVLINSTHTHHAPSTLRVHGYEADDTFAKRVQRAVVQAVSEAHAKLSPADRRFYFHLGREDTVGQNSRQLLPDGMIYWIGPRDQFVRPTGPFDPELPVLSFRDPDGRMDAVIFNHSTHSIGTIQAGVRSPSFYGMAAQELEKDLGAVVCFFEGASGSTHNLSLSGEEMTRRIRAAVETGLKEAEELPVTRLESLKRPFRFKVRTFDEAREEAAVTAYCRKWVGPYGEKVIPVFREMRRHLAAAQGQERETWIQAIRIGEVAMVGVPAEFFTKLGLDLKNRSPFRHTYVAELANDWIGYLPDRDAHELGGYQTWTGYHSYAEPGTGERMVEAAVSLLRELRRDTL